jgi:hypothetical protein
MNNEWKKISFAPDARPADSRMTSTLLRNKKQNTQKAELFHIHIKSDSLHYNSHFADTKHLTIDAQLSERIISFINCVERFFFDSSEISSTESKFLEQSSGR